MSNQNGDLESNGGPYINIESQKEFEASVVQVAIINKEIESDLGSAYKILEDQTGSIIVRDTLLVEQTKVNEMLCEAELLLLRLKMSH